MGFDAPSTPLYFEPPHDPSGSESSDDSSNSDSSMDLDASNDPSSSESSDDSSNLESSMDVDVPSELLVSKPPNDISNLEPTASSSLSVQAAFPININRPTVQFLSIQWLDLRRVFRDFGDFPNFTHSDFPNTIKLIIDKHNDGIKKRNKIEHEDDDNEKYYHRSRSNVEIDNYHFVYYAHITTGTPSIATESEEKPTEKRNCDYIIFIYKEKSPLFVSLTTGNAWQVVRPYVNFKFPIKVAEKIADIQKIIKLKRRYLLGDNLQEEILHPSENICYQMSNLYHFIDSFKCDVKTDSNFLELITKLDREIKQQKKSKEKGKKETKKTESEEESSKRCWIEVRTGGSIRIGKRLRIKDYSHILDLFAKYMADKKQDGTDFQFLTFLRPVGKFLYVELNESLIKSCYSKSSMNMKILGLHVRHRRLEDFLLSTSFEIKVNSTPLEIKSNPPNIEEIIEKIYNLAGNENETDFVNKFNKCTIEFIHQATDQPSIPENLIDCIEGEYLYKEIMYFKIRKMWYELTPDYLTLLCEDLKRVIANSLINESSKWQLHRRWEAGLEEKYYNRYFLNDERVLVLDRILSSFVESCDILKYTDNLRDPVYLYHVKDGFDKVMREVGAQILVAARNIKNAITSNKTPMFLEKLFENAANGSTGWRLQVAQKISALGKQGFVDLFRKRPIIFVLAIRLGESHLFSKALKKIGEGIEERIIQKLKAANYLDEHGRLTRNFHYVTKEHFRIEGETIKISKAIYDKLRAREFYSQSTTAKLLLIQLAQDLQTLGFGFKICEIHYG